MPEGRGTHVLKSRGRNPVYYDTARTGGVGGKANSKQGGNKAMFGSDMRMVATAVIEAGEEIFVDYGSEYEWEGVPEDREGTPDPKRCTYPSEKEPVETAVTYLGN